MTADTVTSSPAQRLRHRWATFATPRIRIAVESILLVLVVVCAVIWFYAPYYARDYINRKLGALPDYNGRVEWVRFHPIGASVDVYDFHVDKRGNEIPVHYFYSPRWHVALQWSEIVRGVFRSSVTIINPRLNLVDGPNQAQSQLGISGIWIEVIKQLIPFRVNRLIFQDGDIHFINFHADPKVDLEIQHVQLFADNMSNSYKLQKPLPATVKITARPLVTGFFEMNISVNLDEKFATFAQNFKMEHVPAVGADSAVEKYAKVKVKSGEIGLYSELTGDKGIYHGYAKPFFYKLEFEPKASDSGTPGAIWSGIVNAVKGIFEDNRDVIATQVPISGRVDQPNVDMWDAIGGALWNAYIHALSTGFDKASTPAPPTDTVTTPKSEQTREEARQKSPADKK